MRELYQQLVQFVRDRMSHIILRGRLCHIIFLSFHTPIEDKTDDVKDSFYEELESVFHKLPKYHMQILLGDFNAKVGKENIFKPTIENSSLYGISNDNGVGIQHLALIKLKLNFNLWLCFKQSQIVA
jgi:hypothetical protein